MVMSYKGVNMCKRLFRLILMIISSAFISAIGCVKSETPVVGGKRRDWDTLRAMSSAESKDRQFADWSKYPHKAYPDDLIVEKYYLDDNQFVFIFNRSGQRVGFSADSQTSVSDLYKSGTIFIYGEFTDGEVRVFEGSPWKK